MTEITSRQIILNFEKQDDRQVAWERLRPLPELEGKFASILTERKDAVQVSDFALDIAGNVVFRYAELGPPLSWQVLDDGRILQYTAATMEDCLLKPEDRSFGYTFGRFLMVLKEGHDFGIPNKTLWNATAFKILCERLNEAYDVKPKNADCLGIPLQWAFDSTPAVRVVQELKTNPATRDLFKEDWNVVRTPWPQLPGTDYIIALKDGSITINGKPVDVKVTTEAPKASTSITINGKPLPVEVKSGRVVTSVDVIYDKEAHPHICSSEAAMKLCDSIIFRLLTGKPLATKYIFSVWQSKATLETTKGSPST